MNIRNWQNLLKEWSQQVLINNKYIIAPHCFGEPSFEIKTSEWLGYSGASNTTVSIAEARLGTQLPPSYKNFLSVTNGWRQTTQFVQNLWSVENIDWFYKRNKKFVEDFSIDPIWVDDVDYFTYGTKQESFAIRTKYFETALEISQWSDSTIYLLNPQIVENGEWEAWVYSSWLPGATRYPSFWELMQAEYQNFLNLL